MFRFSKYSHSVFSNYRQFASKTAMLFMSNGCEDKNPLLFYEYHTVNLLFGRVVPILKTTMFSNA